MALEGRTEIIGTIEQIVYKSDETGYTVADVFDTHGELFTAVGIMPYVNEGDTVTLSGRWVEHKSYGMQFEVEYFECTLPSEETDILKYLASGAIKGVGPKIAERIVGRYGGESFDIIENHPEWLTDIPGISAKKAREISESFKSQFAVRNIMMLSQGEFSLGVCNKIHKTLGNAACERIQKNPYMLFESVPGIGFEKCDRLASLFGIPCDSMFRIKSALRYILITMGEREGHTYLPLEAAAQNAASMLSLPLDKINEAIDEAVSEKSLVRVNMSEHTALYTKYNYECEVYIARKLLELKHSAMSIDAHDKRLFIDRLEIEYGISYADMQRRAVEAAIDSGVMILTGGPGTGKTTIVRACLRIFENMGMNVALAAPTGRAAKRMSDQSGAGAKTIHRLLEMVRDDDEEMHFKRDENNPIDADVIIIDEASMLGAHLFYSLLKALKPSSRLMLIGDSNQLPSVGAGNVLFDLIASEKFCTVTLTEIFRQASESLIVTNAHAINRGEMPSLAARDSDFFFMQRESDMSIAQTVVELCAKRLPKKYGERARSGLQVICPTKNGAAGTESLNKLLKEELNVQDSNKAEKSAHGILFREGDKVMQIKNNYDIAWTKNGAEGLGIFNGDIGIIEKIDLDNESVSVSFDSRIAVYEFSMLDELEHSYAITIHKSQGSEYPIVIIPLGSASPTLLTRNMLYTAITRAGSMVIIVGRESVISAMVNNNFQSTRHTGLCEALNNL